MPAIRWSSTARPTNSRCCLPAWCGRESCRSSATASCSIPHALLDEIAKLKKQGVDVTPDNLRIAENTALILPLHRELDAIRESANAALRIGTTRRGIGPAYEDKVGRRAIRLMDLADGATLDRKIERLLTHHNALRKGLGLEPIDAQDVRKELDKRGAVGAALYGFGVVAARPEAPRGQAHLVRRRAGRAARRRPWHLSIRDLLEYGCGAGGDRIGTRPRRDRIRARHLQGLHDARRRGSVSDRTEKRDRPDAWANAARNSAS